jgi:hypothetical protein
MMKAPNFKFQVFEAKELIPTLSREMRDILLRLYLWQESTSLESYPFTVESFSLDQGGQGEFKVHGELPVNFQESTSFCYLPLKKGHFFSKVVDIKKIEKDDWVIVLDLKIFMLESREQERLITVPHHQVYIYLKVPKDELHQNTNVISMRAAKLPKEEMKEFQIKHLGESELIGFRVVDLSKNGFSFLAVESDHEKMNFIFSKNLSLTLMFNGTSFFLQMAKIIYSHPYVNPKVKKVPMFKVGVEYGPNEKLQAELEKFLDNQRYDPFECHAFENFILGKNEEFQIE